MQLNNSKTGGILLIYSIDFNQQNITANYVIYEDGSKSHKLLSSSQTMTLDYKTYKPLLIETIYTTVENFAYNELTKKHTDFAISEDSQNWLISLRTMRMFISKNFIFNILQDSAHPLFDLINAKMNENASFAQIDKYVFINEINTTVYLNTILQSDVKVLQPFIDNKAIIVENKIS